MGWIANALFAISNIALGRKMRSGWLYSVVANALYVCVGLQHDMWDLTTVSFTLGLLSIWSYVKWGENEQTNHEVGV